MNETVAVQPEASKRYYKTRLWGYFPNVRKEINRRISGDLGVNWAQHFRSLSGDRTFEKVLILNCGKGWVERNLYNRFHLFKHAVGVDVSDFLIKEAQKEAKDLPITYIKLDVNTGLLPEGPFDLVINHSACHHIAYIDRVLRKVCQILQPDGYFVNYDYVGPHRNQYPYELWSSIWQLNKELPEHLRRDLGYPHLPTMLANDKSEAVHSELIVNTTHRYFNFVEHKHIGGALAYEVLSKNLNLMQATKKEQDEWVNYVLRRDLEYLEANPHASFFDFFLCQPEKTALEKSSELIAWEQEEIQREEAANLNGGKYYDLTCFQELYLAFCQKRLAVKHKQLYIDKLNKKLALKCEAKSNE